GRDGGEQPEVFGRERTFPAIGDGQRSYRTPLRAQRRDRGRANYLTLQQLNGPPLGCLADLDALAGHGEPQESRVLYPDLSSFDLGEVAGGGNSTERTGLLINQGNDGSFRLQEARGITGDLLCNALELDRLGQDVAQLLQRKQLADAPIELAGCFSLASLGGN